MMHELLALLKKKKKRIDSTGVHNVRLYSHLESPGRAMQDLAARAHLAVGRTPSAGSCPLCSQPGAKQIWGGHQVAAPALGFMDLPRDGDRPHQVVLLRLSCPIINLFIIFSSAFHKIFTLLAWSGHFAISFCVSVAFRPSYWFSENSSILLETSQGTGEGTQDSEVNY